MVGYPGKEIATDEIHELIAVLFEAYNEDCAGISREMAIGTYIETLASLVAKRIGGYGQLDKLARNYHNPHTQE